MELPQNDGLCTTGATQARCGFPLGPRQCSPRRDAENAVCGGIDHDFGRQPCAGGNPVSTPGRRALAAGHESAKVEVPPRRGA